MKDSIRRKSTTFFMLVINRNCMFGDYGVKSFKKIYSRFNRPDADFKVLNAEFYFHLLLTLQNPDSKFIFNQA